MTISKDKPSSPASAEHAQPKRESGLEDEFQNCAAAWKRDTGHLSVAGRYSQAPEDDTTSIVEMGFRNPQFP